jgi:hypothetical protein
VSDAAAARASAAGAPQYTIQGRTVTLPVEVRDALAVSATFVVNASAARRLLPTPALRLVEIMPGRALCALAAVEYRENDLGQYNEVAVNFFVTHRPVSSLPLVGAVLAFMRGEVGVYVHRLPVTTSFSRDAGRDIWGFPKTVDEIAVSDVADRRRATWRVDGVEVLTLAVMRSGSRTMPATPQDAYTWHQGRLHRTPSVMRATGFGIRPGGAELTLGLHPIADELRTLGLPRRALMSMSMDHLAATFQAAQEV